MKWDILGILEKIDERLKRDGSEIEFDNSLTRMEEMRKMLGFHYYALR